MLFESALYACITHRLDYDTEFPLDHRVVLEPSYKNSLATLLSTCLSSDVAPRVDVALPTQAGAEILEESLVT